MNLDTIINGDCIQGMRELPDESIDLIIMDPPYDLGSTTGGGSFGDKARPNTHKLDSISKGITNESLEETLRVMKNPNIYIWCNKKQLRQYIDFYEDAGCFTELLTWHKTNPIPRCSNQYLPDTEYLLLFRKNAPLYGSYETKRKWYVSPINIEDRKRYGHPTIKPLDIVKNLIFNSSRGGGYDEGWRDLYRIFNRVSCWCCPLASIGELRKLWKFYPDLWARLQEWEDYMNAHGPYYAKFKQDWTVKALGDRFAKEDKARREQRSLTEWIA